MEDHDKTVKTEFTLASALNNFDDETEARICAFLNEAEGARVRGNLLGWSITTGPQEQAVAVLLPTGEIVRAKASTLNQAFQEFSRQLLGGSILGKA